MDTHRLPVRETHWINAAAMFVMIMSGWRIYNASPLFPFAFPRVHDDRQLAR
jgi:thiosulfate reductase cytochrome b subunit